MTQQPTSASGEQYEIAFGTHRAEITEVGAGLRSYTVDGRDVIDGYDRDEMCPSGDGQILAPWPNRLEDGAYDFGGRRHQVPLNEPEAPTRSTGSSAGTRGSSETGSPSTSPWSIASIPDPATPSRSCSPSSTRCQTAASACERPR